MKGPSNISERHSSNRGPWFLRFAVVATALCASGCTQEMYDQPRYEWLEASEFFPDGQSARPPVEGTVARGERWAASPYFTGTENGEPVAEIPPDPRTSQPFTITREGLERGRQRFEIYCSACHGRTGYGDGMVVRRGFPRPPSLHEPRLRDDTPPGHYFRVITHGFKTMPAQGSRIAPGDRWAIVSYINALQRSQHLDLNDAPDDIRAHFKEGDNEP